MRSTADLQAEPGKAAAPAGTRKGENRITYEKKHTTPVLIHIGRGASTARLYSLENDLNKALMAVAIELSKVLKIPQKELWTRAIPHALFDLMESGEKGAAEAACVGWMAYQEYLKALQRDREKK